MPKSISEMTGKDIRIPMLQHVIQDQDLLNRWESLTRGVFDNVKRFQTLQCIIDFYVQIRGFSFAENIVEKCKEKQKLHQKGSKALRKNLKHQAADK